MTDMASGGGSDPGIGIISGLSRPLLYVVAYASDDDGDGYLPIVFDPEPSRDVTAPHQLSREMIPALPALWYCLHLPKTAHDLVDLPYRFMADVQSAAMRHVVALMPLPAVRKFFVIRGRDVFVPTLLIGPDSEAAELDRLTRALRFRLPAVRFSQLSAESLRGHWHSMKAEMAAAAPGQQGTAIEPVRGFETAGVELPLRRLAQKMGWDSSDLPDDAKRMLDRLLYGRDYHAALANFEAVGATDEVIDAGLESAVDTNLRSLRHPLTIGFPGVAPAQTRIYGPPVEAPAGEPESPSWPGSLAGVSDAEIERSVTALLVAKEAVSQDSVGLMLSECPPAAYVALADLERHCKNGARPRAVWRILDRLDAALEPVWSELATVALSKASALTVFSDFPLGLGRPPGFTAPLSSALPLSSRPLSPLTRHLPSELLPRHYAIKDRYRILIAECILPEDPVGQASRQAWTVVAGELEGGPATLVREETLTIGALRAAVSLHCRRPRKNAQ